ncbi:MAG TPA: alpha/beta fold hydrolase [Thermoanaerobaculia bacterium]
MKHSLRLALCLWLATVASAGVRLVDVGGHKMRVLTDGAGASVVFEAGFTETLDTWRDVIPAVAKIARVVAYDRAGLGQSEAVEGVRSYAALANDLHTLLLQEKVPPPFLLVGHSYGGPLSRVFCHLYPAEVRGIVFVDPMSETLNIADPKRAEHMAQQEAALKGASRGVMAEWAYLRKESDRDFADLQKVPRPDVPMALIVATIDRPDGWRKGLLDQYGQWIESRNDSVLIVTPNSSHIVQRDEPGLVVGAIRSLLFPNPIVALESAAGRGGAEAVAAVFRQQLATYPEGEIAPRALNTVGYHLLRDKKIADAVKVFALNAATFPSDANAYDSLGEAYLANGDRSAALANYRKAFEMDASNSNAKKAIDELTAH